MGLIDKAGELVSTAAGRVGAVISELPELPGVDPERLRIVIEVVWENKDLLVRLPTVLGDAGEQMQAAGAGAREVGGFLSGEVHELTAQAADTLEACRKPIAQVGEVLDELGGILDRLPIVGNVAEPATRGLGALTEVAVNIERVAVQLRGLSASMQGAGLGLDAMGASLQGGGVALTTVSGRTIVQAAAARRQEPTEERPRRGASDPSPTGFEAVDFSEEAPVDPPGADVPDGQIAGTRGGTQFVVPGGDPPVRGSATGGAHQAPSDLGSAPPARPKPRKGSTRKASAQRTAPAKKATAAPKKAPTKKTPTKKAPTKKASTKKASARKATAKRSPAKKATSQKRAPRA